MHILKKLFFFLILLSILAVSIIVYRRQIAWPKHCLSSEITVHHPDYVKCGPIVEQNWLLKAQNGDATAAYKLALLYDAGDRVSADQARAIHWIQKAEQKNLPDAQYVMAVWSERGYFGAAGANLTIPLYEAAARQGHLNAMKSLANIYRETNPEEHQFWMQKIRTYK